MDSQAVNIWWLAGPGGGKGTQAREDSRVSGRPVVTVSDLLERVVADPNSALGAKVKDCMDKGELVSDKLVYELVAQEYDRPYCDNGTNLDGLRTKEQAAFLNGWHERQGIRPPLAIYLKVDVEVLKYRIAHRVICSKCKISFHLIDDPPPTKDNCHCGGSIVRRKDDDPEVLANRLKKFEEKFEPLRLYLIETKQLITIECGRLNKYEIAALIREELARRGR